MAVSDYAYDKGPAPFELIEDSLCVRYHCLPPQLDALEDIGRVMRNMQASMLYEAIKAEQNHSATPEQHEMVGDVLQTELDEESDAG